MRINIRIEGTTPLIVNRFTDAAAMAATSMTRASSNNGESADPKSDAESRLYTGDDGNPVVPQMNLFRCIIDAGKFHKIGKCKVTTIKSSLIPACVSMDGLEYPIVSPGWEVDERPIRNPATGGRFLRYRPRFNEWSVEFTADIDETMIGPKLFRQIVDDAGKKIGLGDFRPACKGPFGKFVVTDWEVEKDEALAA